MVVTPVKVYVLIPLTLNFLLRLYKPTARRTLPKRVRFQLDYDPGNCNTLDAFLPLKKQTPCLFARAAKLRGAPDWKHSLGIAENIELARPALSNFIADVKEGVHKIDGFLFQIHHDDMDNILSFAKAVREALMTMTSWNHEQSSSASSTFHYDCLKSSYIQSARWQFQVLNLDIFVTTFSPCYPSNHPRYNAGIQDCAFILLQPMESFLWKDLPAYKTERHTDYSQPPESLDIRERIRLNFRNMGQALYVPESLQISMAEQIVPPVDKLDSTIIHWWEEKPHVHSS